MLIGFTPYLTGNALDLARHRYARKYRRREAETSPNIAAGLFFYWWLFGFSSFPPTLLALRCIIQENKPPEQLSLLSPRPNLEWLMQTSARYQISLWKLWT